VSQAPDSRTGDRCSDRDRRGVKRAPDHRTELSSSHGNINVEEFKKEKEFRSLWDSFKSNIYDAGKVDKAILTLDAVITEACLDGDLEKVKKYENMLNQIERARRSADTDGGHALRELKFE